MYKHLCTCSKSNQCSGCNQENNSVGLDVLQISIQDVSQDVNDQGDNQRFPASPHAVSHLSKERGGNQLPYAIRSNHPAQEIGGCTGFKLVR